MNRIVWTALLGFLCLEASAAQAQFVGRGGAGRVGVGRVSPFVYGGYSRGYGYGAGYGYGNSAGGELMGMSSVITASSNAMSKYEDTRSKYIDNRLKWQKTYYEMTSNYQTHVEERNTKEVAVRDKYLENRPSGAPARLSPSQLDPVTGTVAWPEALQSDDFDANRKRIEELLEVRAHSSNGSQTSKEIRDRTSDMLRTLKGQISELPPNEYISARKFLDSLSYETQVANR